MPSALTHNAVTATQTIKPLVPQINLTGLDSARMEIDFHGTVDGLLTTYRADGSTTAPGHPDMYCVGVGDIASARFGWIQATILYSGFWFGAPPILSSYEIGTTEQLYPYAAGDVVYYYPNPPGTSTITNPATGRFWRVRDINNTALITRRGVEIVSASAAASQLPPAPTATKPSDAGTPANIKDPLISTRFGWVRRKFTVTAESIIGGGNAARAFRFWEDVHEWVEQKSL